jgi:uncharacterized membrane protein
LNTKLEKVFKQAQLDYASVDVSAKGYVAYIYLGVKITRDDETGEIIIYDPIKSVNYYIEIEKDLYELFYKKGWKKAVIEMTLEKYKDKLERIQNSVSNEMNGSQSQKRLKFFKETREMILNKYYKLTQKLNND